jgi:hypothetical protein
MHVDAFMGGGENEDWVKDSRDTFVSNGSNKTYVKK